MDGVYQVFMKVLFVFSGNSRKGISPFIKEQAESLVRMGISVGYFPIVGRGICGYGLSYLRLRRVLSRQHFDLLHGHYIWSVLICLFNRKIPVVGTFHGTDLKPRLNKFLAKLFAVTFLDAVIVVNRHMKDVLNSRKVTVIPCGVNTDIFYPHEILEKEWVAKKLCSDSVNILFASDFQQYVKNYPLARDAIELISAEIPVNLIELKEYSRAEVSCLLNSVSLLVLTSLWEGSPQVVKEAMACNCQIVATDVGDTKWLLEGLEGCYVASHDPHDVASKIKLAIQNARRTRGLERLLALGLDTGSTATKILAVYHDVLRRKGEK